PGVVVPEAAELGVDAGLGPDPPPGVALLIEPGRHLVGGGRRVAEPGGEDAGAGARPRVVVPDRVDAGARLLAAGERGRPIGLAPGDAADDPGDDQGGRGRADAEAGARLAAGER